MKRLIKILCIIFLAIPLMYNLGCFEELGYSDDPSNLLVPNPSQGSSGDGGGGAGTPGDGDGAVGVADPPAAQTLRLARLATSLGIAGLVCSCAEVATLRNDLGPDVVLVTPGIRQTSSIKDDQKRTGTPAGAIRAGSSLLVVGRPIRDAPDPAAAARSILSEIAGATG